MNYRTIIAVVPADEADAILRVLHRNDDIRFAGSVPGITPDALAAGAQPEDWGDEDLDPQLAESIARGLEQSAAGDTVYLGDFSQYVADE
jgi:hypothetical protein